MSSVPGGDMPEPEQDLPPNYCPPNERINSSLVVTPVQVVRWACDYLGVRLTRVQREIIVTALSNPRTVVVSGNGVGKSWGLAVLIVAFMFTRSSPNVLATSGTYPKLRRTLCKPVQDLHENDHTLLPGRYKHSPPRIEVDGRPDVFFEAASPSDPGELEGVHSANVLGVIEEADKDAVDEEVIDSMTSIVTDERDHLVVIANPPDDETDLVSQLMDDPTWKTLRYTAFDSHNVEVELDRIEYVEKADPTASDRTTPNGKVDGLVSLSQIKDDWESWNNEPWPGVDEARASAEREDLDERWHRRRLGAIPPSGGMRHRPFKIDHVNESFFDTNRYVETRLPTGAQKRDGPFDARRIPLGLALDVARKGGDRNVMAGRFRKDELDILDKWTDLDHEQAKHRVLDNLPPSWTVRFAVDATGEGSGLADALQTGYPRLVRYNAGSKAIDERRYKDCWTESLALMGDFLKGDGWYRSRRLRDELAVAARVVEYDETYIKSRDCDVLAATPKSDIKDELGRSPDYLDAACQAIWAAEAGSTGSSRKPRGRRPRGSRGGN